MTASDRETNTDMHPSDETLAAWVDGRLAPAERETVVEHLAACADCRDVVMAATEFREQEAQQAGGGTVVRPAFGVRLLWPLAAAAMLALVFLSTPLRYEVFGRTPAALVEAAAGLERRPGLGRLSGGFAYADVSDPARGHGAANPAAGTPLAEVVAQNENAMFPNARTAAVTAMLLADELPELDAAVARFQELAAKASGRDRDLLESDLAAALIARGSWKSDPADFARAFQLADGAWKRNRSAEAAWNRAIALQRLGRSSDALLAWKDYLAIDPSSPWAAEAKQHMRMDD